VDDATAASAVLSSALPAGTPVLSAHPLMSWTAILCSLIAAAILSWFLLRRPALTGEVKVLLLLGFGVFPIGAALTGNVAGFEHTKNRSFCGSCHVMGPYLLDSDNPLSKTLAASHARNEEFGAENCYQCHRDYGAFSTIVTKLGGMRHVYEYYTHYYKVDVDTAVHEIELYKPLANASCMRCHSTEVAGWQAVGAHRSSLQDLRSGRVSCASAGCHGPSHPFSKPKRHATEVQP
jgi:nitrate/TMAO reductase-like tetraheme cytochrome c subunit